MKPPEHSISLKIVGPINYFFSENLRGGGGGGGATAPLRPPRMVRPCICVYACVCDFILEFSLRIWYVYVHVYVSVHMCVWV